LAAELREQFPGIEIEMIPSSRGRFEVVADGEAIFEKSKLDRHARPGEIARLVAAKAQ
jgi:selT/selW/selH-like putative selenoprotein